MVLLSGHAATWELGRGGFQEIRQADMAAPVTKASWTATSAATLGHDLGEAIRIATSGRPGPVHLSLPSDLLEERVESNAIVWPSTQSAAATVPALPEAVADAMLAAIAGATRPIILAGPALSSISGRALIKQLEAVTKAPAVIMESPRGIADATLGAFPDLVRRVDLIVLLGKALDFTTGGHRVRLRSRRATDRDRSRGGAGRARRQREGRPVADRLYRRRPERRRDAHRPRRKHQDTRRRLAGRGPRCARPAARRMGHVVCADAGPTAPGRGLPRACALCRTTCRHGSDLRRRGVCPMGPEHAARAPAPC